MNLIHVASRHHIYIQVSLFALYTYRCLFTSMHVYGYICMDIGDLTGEEATGFNPLCGAVALRASKFGTCV